VDLRYWPGIALILLVAYLLFRRNTENLGPRLPRVPWEDQASGYKVYQRAYDEEVPAESLATPHDLIRRRDLLDAQLDRYLAGAGEEIARRLDQGVPVSVRSAGIVVGILLDNSGSMRRAPGAPVSTVVPFSGDCEPSSGIMLTACATDLLVEALERCSIKVEVLGFTTVAWKGGRSRRDWQLDGMPAEPGRLNEVRHILYKTADATGPAARRSLGVMLDASLLKENVDGEALAWAHSRLMARAEARRILLVISDGAPVDDSTLSVNAGNYLEQHLRHVIDEIERRSPVELTAIGIGYDVTSYYRRATIIKDPADLAGAMTAKLVELFAGDDPRAQDQPTGLPPDKLC
jgi:cobaltochelatase CobT